MLSGRIKKWPDRWLEEGRQEGKLEAKREIARNLILSTAMDDQTIAGLSELPVGEVATLRAETQR